jgi:hypothetical protein
MGMSGPSLYHYYASRDPRRLPVDLPEPHERAQHQPDSARFQAGLRFAHVLLDMLIELWITKPFPVPDLDELPSPCASNCAPDHCPGAAGAPARRGRAGNALLRPRPKSGSGLSYGVSA